MKPKYLWSFGWNPQKVTFFRLKKYSWEGTPPPLSWNIKSKERLMARASTYPGLGFVHHLDPFITNLQYTGSLLISFPGHLYHRLKNSILWNWVLGFEKFRKLSLVRNWSFLLESNLFLTWFRKLNIHFSSTWTMISTPFWAQDTLPR